jgi:alpha-beta hydrolase superfamily lysophospholipase
MTVAINATPVGNELPLVAISHGGGGTSLPYRDTAAALVRAGFVVLLLEHPGNNRTDNSLEGTRANLENRPRHLRLALDATFADSRLGHLLAPGKVAVIGHSMGGYTALAAAGARPMAGPDGAGGMQLQAIDVALDPRIKALVLLAPACGWFAYPGALQDLALPIFLRSAEKDVMRGHLYTHIIKEGVPDAAQVDAATVANAGHHSFQSPFPPSMCRPDFPPSQDPPGFDRPAFLDTLNAQIVSFLRQHLG